MASFPPWFVTLARDRSLVVRWSEVVAAGLVKHARLQIAAGRWQRVGPGLLLLSGEPLSPAARVVVGPGAVPLVRPALAVVQAAAWAPTSSVAVAVTCESLLQGLVSPAELRSTVAPTRRGAYEVRHATFGDRQQWERDVAAAHARLWQSALYPVRPRPPFVWPRDPAQDALSEMLQACPSHMCPVGACPVTGRACVDLAEDTEDLYPGDGPA